MERKLKLLHERAMGACVQAAEALLARGAAAELRADLAAFARVNFEGVIDPDSDLRSLQPPITPPIVAAAAQDELFAMSRKGIEILYRLLNRAYAMDLRAFARSLGWSDAMMRTLDADDLSNRLALEIARPDVLVHGGRPYVLELNVDCAVGGKMTGSRALESARRLPHLAAVAARFPLQIRSPIEGLKSLIVEAARQRGVSPRIRAAIVDYSSETYLRQFEARLLSNDTIDARFVAVDGLAVSPDSPFTDYDVILKCCEISETLSSWPASTLASFLDRFSDRSRVVLSNGHSTLLSNKLVFGLVADQLECDEEARDFFESHVPWSRCVKPGRVCFHGEEVDMLDLLQAPRRSQFVLKNGFGWGGNGVLWGGQCSEQVWHRAVKQALSSGQCLLQEYLRPDTLEMPFLGNDERIVWRPVSVLLGPFVFGSTAGGCQYVLTQDVGAGMSGPRYQSAGYASFTVEG